MKKRIGYILYGLCGAALLAGTLGSTQYGLSEQNQKIYEEAKILQPAVDALGFADLTLTDYKVRFYNGRSDFVVDGDKIQKEKAAFSSFVGTTAEIDGEYQVILPTVENFKKLFDVMNTAAGISEGKSSFEASDYGADEHTATLWHETFHAYQMTHYLANIDQILGESMETGDNLENTIVKTVDSQPDMVRLYQDQMVLLKEAYAAEDLADKKDIIRRYLAQEQDRQKLLPDKSVRAERYYETVEGTACYVESYIHGLLTEWKSFEKMYIDAVGYAGGSGKYYKSGMIKCYLLDELQPDWKRTYQFDHSLDELLSAACK